MGKNELNEEREANRRRRRVRARTRKKICEETKTMQFGSFIDRSLGTNTFQEQIFQTLCSRAASITVNNFTVLLFRTLEEIAHTV